MAGAVPAGAAGGWVAHRVGADHREPASAADRSQIGNRLRRGAATPEGERLPAAEALTMPYREDRSFRLIEVDETASTRALRLFTDTVGQIERAVEHETRTGDARSGWQPREEERTCIACDFKYHCPERRGQDRPLVP